MYRRMQAAICGHCMNECLNVMLVCLCVVDVCVCDDDDDDDLYSAIIHVSMLKAQVSVRKKGTHKKEDRQQHTKTK